jgi:outer membrane lipoprotein-sorting protein
MRGVLVVLLLPAFAAAGGGGDKAEKLYRDLEKKATEAGTARAAFESRLMKGEKEVGRLKGVVDLNEGNRARMEIKGLIDEKDITLEITADGKTSKIVATPPGKQMEEPLPKNNGTIARAGLVRVGPTASLLMTRPRAKGEGDKELDLDKLLSLSDFKLGANAKVEGREARVIEYKVTPMGAPNAVAVRLWLDAKTHLPLKRELSDDRSGVRVIESYSEFKLGRKGGAKPPAPPK